VSTTRRHFTILMLTTVLLAAVGLAACSDGSANGIAVRVGTAAITSREVAHWMAVISGEVSTAPGSPEPPVPDPPHYSQCVTYRRAYPTTFSTGSAAAAKLISECAGEYEKEKLKALYWLVPYAWVNGEAEELGVAPSEAEVSQAASEFEAPAPNAALARRTLIGTRGTTGDLLSRLRLILLTKLIQQKLESAPAMRRMTLAQRQQALERFGHSFLVRWTARSVCSGGYEEPLCNNYRGSPQPFGLVPPSIPLTDLAAQ
jgi:hypothetical protein